MNSLSFYVGSWQCDGTSFATQGQSKEEHWKARMEVAPGWTGSHMVWKPEAAQEKYHATFTKLGEDRYAHLVVADTDHGEEKVWEKVCTKVRS